MIEGRPRESLVQYENPIEVPSFPCFLPSILYRYQQDRTLMTLSRRALEVTQSNILTIITVLLIKYSNLGKKKATLPPMETKPSSEDILNAILPPREWVENGMLSPIYNIDIIRKALHSICESLASFQSGCCKTQGNA